MFSCDMGDIFINDRGGDVGNVGAGGMGGAEDDGGIGTATPPGAPAATGLHQ